MRLDIAATVTLLFASLLFPAVAAAAPNIVDLSYDKCASSTSSHAASWLGHFKFGIIGVNAGGDWEENHCLGDETKHFDAYALYVNTNFPSSSCPGGLQRKAAYRCGYDLGLWDVKYASIENAHSNTWFLDVEEGPGIPWSGNDSLNSVFLYGLAKGLEAMGASNIGYYSTTLQWNDITSGWNSHGHAWYATGSIGKPSSGTAGNACKSAFTGGTVVLYQFIVGDLDNNDRC